MPKLNTRKIADAKNSDHASSRMGDALKDIKSDEPAIYYEKSATIRQGDDYFRATVGITSVRTLNGDDILKIEKRLETLADVLDKEIQETLDLELRDA